FVAKNKHHFEAIQPSFFEMTVALCFDYFAREQMDLAIIETGLGGRLDSTNVITPELSVITNIGWDHTDMLGDTLPKIAFEKAGIIKPGVPVIIGETHPETESIFINKAKETGSPIQFADKAITLQDFDNTGETAVLDVYQGEALLFKDLECDLTGIYQQKNIAAVLTALLQLKQAGWEISNGAIRKGLRKVKTNTGLAGRWHKLADSPLTYCDTGHNYEGVQEVLKQIGLLKFNRLHIVWGMVKDKDITKILALLPKDAVYYFCNAAIPRALPAAEMKNKAAEFGLAGEDYASVELALKAAQAAAAADDMVFVGGSTFVVAEVV
ncbi:MAG TPA: Mur ligase family protein, partial [Bacteroidia bacterium]|nr:Mur ligase family protein [Bacteroidia bacterium]